MASYGPSAFFDMDTHIQNPRTIHDSVLELHSGRPPDDHRVYGLDIDYDMSATLSSTTLRGVSSPRPASTTSRSTSMPPSTISISDDSVYTAPTTSTSTTFIFGIAKVQNSGHAFTLGYILAILGLYIANSSTASRNYDSLRLHHRLLRPPSRLRSSWRPRQSSSSPPCGYGPPHVHLHPLSYKTLNIMVNDYLLGRYFYPPRLAPSLSSASLPRLELEGARTTFRVMTKTTIYNSSTRFTCSTGIAAARARKRGRRASSGNFDIKLPRRTCARPIDSIGPDPDLE